MKKSFFISKLISAIFITMVLLYFMIKTTSPKIIFIPFLICSISMAGQNAALILEKKKYALAFHKLFDVGFLLFWFGCLAIVCYVCVRDKNYKMMVFSLPFWLVGIYLIRNKLLNVKSKKLFAPKFNLGIIISAGLVIVALLAGVIILILGIVEFNVGLIFAGAFFTFGAFTFVVAFLTVQGVFDKLKIDVLGMYIGILFVAIGIGFIAMISSFEFWILIPILMVVAGVIQIGKCIRNRK